jgi:hypothetical protein
MDSYKFYVNPANGHLTEATAEEIQNDAHQILCIAGIESVSPPPIWVGEYHGEMIFRPSKFESLNGMETMHIQIGNTIIAAIQNTDFGRYQIQYYFNGEMATNEVEGLRAEFIRLSQL